MTNVQKIQITLKSPQSFPLFHDFLFFDLLEDYLVFINLDHLSNILVGWEYQKYFTLFLVFFYPQQL